MNLRGNTPFGSEYANGYILSILTWRKNLSRTIRFAGNLCFYNMMKNNQKTEYVMSKSQAKLFSNSTLKFSFYSFKKDQNQQKYSFEP